MEILADKLRPEKLKDIVGQQHLIGENQIIYNLIKNKKIFSMILKKLLFLMMMQMNAKFIIFIQKKLIDY